MADYFSHLSCGQSHVTVQEYTAIQDTKIISDLLESKDFEQKCSDK